MKVWTVVSQDDTDNGSDHLVAGSYTSRGRALDECVDYIFERLEWREGFAWSMAHDENHPDAAKFFSKKKDGRTAVKRGCVEELRRYIRDVLGGDGAYYVYDGMDSWHFDVDENDVEGELWTTVTWGDSDTEDPEFTTPWPETFTSEDEAIRTFVNYAKDLMASQEMDIPDDFYAVVEQQLDEDGKCQVDLADGCCVSCVLYRDDAENVRG